MSAAPVIRALPLPPAAADRRFLEHGMAALNDHERAMEANRLPGAEMARPHVAALLEAATATGGGAMIAEDAAGPAGFAIWLAAEEFGRYVLPENQRYATLSDLWVAPHARRQGLGHRLVRAVEAAVAAEGIRRMEIGALWGNAAARALYERAGYRPASVTLDRVLDD